MSLVLVLILTLSSVIAADDRAILAKIPGKAHNTKFEGDLLVQAGWYFGRLKGADLEHVGKLTNLTRLMIHSTQRSTTLESRILSD